MVKKVFLILTVVFLLICSSNAVQAISISNIIGGADNFLAIGNNDIDNTFDDVTMKNISDGLFNTLVIIGTVVAMIVGAVLGIQFITGSVEQKSKVKETLIPYFVGCVVIFGAFGIWKLVVELLRQVG